MMKILSVLCLVMSLPLLAAPGPAVIGKRVEFSPSSVAPGEQITPTVHFTVEGGRVELHAQWAIVLPPEPGGRLRPTVVGSVVGGTFDPGDRSLALPLFEVPENISSLCFTVQAGIGAAATRQTLVEGACLSETVLSIRAADPGRNSRIRVMTPDPGTAVGDGVVFMPSTARPGATIQPMVGIRVTDAATEITLKWRAAPVVRPGLSLPATEGTLRLGRKGVGNYRFPMPGYRIPTSFFSVIHYTVHVRLPNEDLDQTLINDARIEPVKGYRVSSTGSGRRIAGS